MSDDELVKMYMEVLNKVNSEVPRWEKTVLESPEWKLWESVEALDITLINIRDLLEKARKKRKRRDLISVLERILGLVDEALGVLDPYYWKPPQKSLRDVTLEPKKLKEASTKLEEAWGLFKIAYIDLGIRVEVKRRGEWTMVIPTIYQHLRDAVYGIKQFLSIEEK